jgi:hypothetical protein
MTQSTEEQRKSGEKVSTSSLAFVLDHIPENERVSFLEFFRN